jgi:hypothetical protein
MKPIRFGPCRHQHTQVQVMPDGTVRRWCLRCGRELN